MLSIKNSMAKVAVIYNDNFEVEIPIHKHAVISDEEIGGSNIIYIKFFSLKDEQQSTHFDAKRAFNRRLVVEAWNESVFPTVAEIDINGISELTLLEEDAFMPSLIMFFKKITLKKIRILSGGNECKNVKYSFVNEKDRKRFARFLRWESAFIVPLTAISILGACFAPNVFFENGIGEGIGSLLLIGLCVCVSVNDLYYLHFARKPGRDTEGDS